MFNRLNLFIFFNIIFGPTKWFYLELFKGPFQLTQSSVNISEYI